MPESKSTQFQFSLQTLVIVVLVFAGLFGSIASTASVGAIAYAPIAIVGLAAYFRTARILELLWWYIPILALFAVLHARPPGSHPFDWGVFKPDGERILVVSATIYLGCIVSAICLLHRLEQDEAGPRAIVAIFSFLALIGAAVASISQQMTSIHFQENVHLPALAVIVVGLLAIRWCVRTTAPKSGGSS
jgi:hypothetical protein